MVRWPLQPLQPFQKHSWNHLPVHQWIRSATCDSQKPTPPIGFLFWNFRRRLVRDYWYQLLVFTVLSLLFFSASFRHALMIWAYFHLHFSSSSLLYSCAYTSSLYMIRPVSYQSVQYDGVACICMIGFCIVHQKVSCANYNYNYTHTHTHAHTHTFTQDRSGIGWSGMFMKFLGYSTPVHMDMFTYATHCILVSWVGTLVAWGDRTMLGAFAALHSKNRTIPKVMSPFCLPCARFFNRYVYRKLYELYTSKTWGSDIATFIGFFSQDEDMAVWSIWTAISTRNPDNAVHDWM